ncbi:MAG: hypothetical protein RIT28_3423 [Pseudomonadota bacterium]
MLSSSRPWPIVSLLIAAVAGIGGWALGRADSGGLTEAPVTAPVTAQVVTPPPEGPWPLRAPSMAEVPEGPLGDSIREGYALVADTNRRLPENVGAGMRCTSCHLNGGTVANAGPWVGLTGVFPEHRDRDGRVITIESRINDCFERSLNGKPLDPTGPEMAAIVAYMTWLSQDVPVGVPVEGRGFRRPNPLPEINADPARGEAVYGQRCVSCHGPTGAGVGGADGVVVYPPLWGPSSFNIGAGMARLDTAAAFVRWNMPLGQGGSLTEQEAYDVAAYFTQQERPDFARKMNDWPAGNKPRDARY